MAEFTENLNLEMPDKTEQYNVAVQNSNMQKIDNFSKLIPARALTADKLTLAKKINGVSFDGTQNVITGLGLHSLEETYNIPNIVYGYIDEKIKIYKTKQDENIGHELTDTDWWEEIEISGGSSLGFNLFATQIADHILEGNEAKGWALQGTYVYKEAVAGSRYGYPDFYAKCLEEYSEVASTETVNGITINVNSNGHKFYDIADKSAIDEFYNTYGIADFYGIDEENERIFLPRNKYFFQFTDDTSKVNQMMEAQIPNITGTIGSRNTEASVTSGAFSMNIAVQGEGTYGYMGTTTSQTTFNASRSSSVYKDGCKTVQPPSSLKLLYYCVGNTVSDTSWIDVVTQVQGGVKDLEDKTNEGIEALANASNALRTTQITNCITEIPQNIKIELVDGNPVLKAGSKVYDGNGLLHELTQDTTATLSYDAHQYLFYYEKAGNRLLNWYPEKSGSGDTLPSDNSDYYVFYNTTDKKIYRYLNGAWTSEAGYSFPICIGTGDGTNIVSIDRIFNGVGYIGSTIYVLPNVKGLIPNGRNEDGTLKNIEKILDRIYLSSNSNPDRTLCDFSYDIDQDIVSKTAMNYKVSDDGYIYNNNGELRRIMILGTFSTDSTDKITSFNPKQPFRAMDYSEFNATPHIVETYENGTSGYNVYSNGYCEQWGKLNIAYSANIYNHYTITLLKPYKNTNYNILALSGDRGYIHYSNIAYTTINNNNWVLSTYSTGAAQNSTAYWKTCGYIA